MKSKYIIMENNEKTPSKQILTSVKINDKLWDEFRVACVRYKFSFNKLSERAIHLYLTNEDFRRQLHNHNNLDL